MNQQAYRRLEMLLEEVDGRIGDKMSAETKPLGGQ